jgi:hypothetical protein
MSNLVAKLPWGNVIARKLKGSSHTYPEFKLNPDKYAQLLMKAHQPSGALGIVDSLIHKGNPEGTFWPRVQEVIQKRIKVLETLPKNRTT